MSDQRTPGDPDHSGTHDTPDHQHAPAEPEQDDHAHHGRRGTRTVSDYAHDFFANWNDYDGPLAEKIRLTLRNRTRAYFLPPVKGCCGHRGEPGC